MLSQGMNPGPGREGAESNHRAVGEFPPPLHQAGATESMLGGSRGDQDAWSGGWWAWVPGSPRERVGLVSLGSARVGSKEVASQEDLPLY